MAKILCTLPNASEEISGVKFVAHEKGMLSEEVAADVAERFASIPGYEVVGATAPKAPPVQDDAKAAERAALSARAEAVGLKVKGTWSNDRLATEVEQAEKAAAVAADQPAE